MTITAARLRPYNPRGGQPKRSHTTHDGAVYRSGTEAVPSPLRVVSNRAELRELEALPEFQILTFANEAEMRTFLEQEMYGRVRLGAAPQMAQVHGVDLHAAAAIAAQQTAHAAAVASMPPEAPSGAVVTFADLDEGKDLDEDDGAPVPPHVASLTAPTPVGDPEPVAAPVAQPTPAAAPRVKTGRKPGKK